MIKLKPCPFCGKEAEIRKGAINTGHWYVGCSEEAPFEGCEVRPFTLIGTTNRQQAIEAWNKREES